MIAADDCLTATFATAIDRLGPFEPCPVLAVAVSGGADSMALAVLAQDWVRRRNGLLLALVVDHGLRQASAPEAQLTVERLTCLGIPARLLQISSLKHGPALAERARIMRYETLAEACRMAGILHLLLGHHAADQTETLMMRVLRGSQTHGLAGMSALRETHGLRLLRPLLEIDPRRLRHFLDGRGIEWIEDPSNQDILAMRPRLRHRLTGQTPETAVALAAVGKLRLHEEAKVAAELAMCATIRPEGFALLSSGRISPAALSSLIRTIGGMAYAPPSGQIIDLAAHLRPATIAGVRIIAAGRLGAGFLIVREEAAVMQPVAARNGSVWDNRFRLAALEGSSTAASSTTAARVDAIGGTMVGTLGHDAGRLRRASYLPSAVLRTLPAIRVGKVLAVVPHLGYTSRKYDLRVSVLFSPLHPVAGACFVPAT